MTGIRLTGPCGQAADVIEVRPVSENVNAELECRLLVAGRGWCMQISEWYHITLLFQVGWHVVGKSQACRDFKVGG
jgi:hypothetical protein